MILPTLLLSYFIIMSVQGQLSITWNGTTLTGPVAELIYMDELLVDTTPPFTVGDPDRIGALVCRSGDAADRVSWHLPNGFLVNNIVAIGSSRILQQIRETNALNISRLSRNGAADRADLNGLWHCRRNANEGGAIATVPEELVVGLYDREGISDGTPRDSQGAGINDVSISLSSSFLTAPPTFTLFGDTSFGPPTTNGWTRDGVPINNGGSFSISIGLRGTTDSTYMETRYRSTLTVTGYLPGMYKYFISNRVTNPVITASVTIEDAAAPTGLTIMQTGIGTVTVSWIPPCSPPSRGYRITVDSTGFTSGTDVTSRRSHTLQLTPGTHAIRIIGLSQHLPSEVVGPEMVTVLDLLAPVNIMSPSRTPTSITIFWTQPTNSLPADEYTVSFESVLNALGSGCPTNPAPGIVTSTTTSVVIDNLLEGHPYSITVTASRFGATSAPSTPVTFTTLEIFPSASPSSVMIATVTSRSITATWSEISCLDRNGVITGYAVEFGELGEATMIMEDTTLSFTRDGVTPFTNYTFRVAGVNSAGTGVYSGRVNIRTDEDVPGNVSNLTASPRFFSIQLTWNPPRELNGVIIGYKVTYMLNDNTVTINTRLVTRLNITSLTPNTTIFSVSVAASTTVGQSAINLGDISTLSQPADIMNVTTIAVSDTSVLVYWDRLPIPEITGYIVYYSQTGDRKRQSSEKNVTVPYNSQNFVIISGLTTNVQYQFEVVAVAEVAGDVIMGMRSTSPTPLLIAATASCYDSHISRDISISVLASSLLTIILYTTILLVGCCSYHVHRTRRKRSINEYTGKEKDQDYGESTSRNPIKVEMKVCDESFPSETPQREVVQSEVVYENLAHYYT